MIIFNHPIPKEAPFRDIFRQAGANKPEKSNSKRPENMAKINTPEELRLMREKLRADLEIRENSNTPDELPQIRVRWTNAASPPEPKRSSQHSSKNWPPVASGAS